MSVTTRRLITSPDKIRDAIHSNVLRAIQGKFPMEAGPYRVELKKSYVKHNVLSHNRQKLVLLGKENASDMVYIDFSVTDTRTGKVVADVKDHRFVNIPYFTNRYTLMVDGNEYSIVNQMRTKSGVYTRKRGNDELESSFNLAKGANFKLLMDPETGVFKISILHATLPMHCVVKVLGGTDQDIKAALGEKLYLVNLVDSPAQMERTINTLYSKLIEYKSSLGDKATQGEKAQKIREYFLGTSIDPETTAITLGQPFDKVSFRTILEAAKKILLVFNSEGEVDERDNLEFQKIYSVEDILREVIEKANTEVTKLTNKLKSFKATGKQDVDVENIKTIFSPAYFTKALRNFITTSSISRLPSQINPLEMMDSASIITRLGEGAISSERSVPEETRAVNYSYAGVIDPIATPESSKIGIDTRATIGAKKGTDNEFYKDVLNTKTGKIVERRVIELYNKVVGFPDALHTKNHKPTDLVPATHMGKLVRVPRSQLDYQIVSPHDLNAITTNTIPFVNANQANRVVMGDKHIQQALPLKYRDTRLVEAVMPALGGKKQSTVEAIGSFMLPKSPTDGTVVKVDDNFIYIKGNDGKTYNVDYEHNLPLATKTYMTNDIIVKPGDTVKAGQVLAESNFTKDGKIALGKNLTVAYMPYNGLNHEDAVIITESAAKKLTSVHAEKVTATMDKLSVLDKNKFTMFFPTEFTKSQLNKLDSRGVALKGATLEYGDPIILLMEDNSQSRTNQVLGMLHKSLIAPYRNTATVYDGHYPAEVLEVHTSGNTITVLLRMEKPAGVGDKLAGSYGNKGVISRIIPDEHMVKDESGKAVDVVFTPVGVIGRINAGQTLESTLGKIALKTGKPYKVENFSHDDYVSFVKAEAKKHNVVDKETMTDPLTGKKISGVFVGVQHLHKLMKTSDTNFAARGIEGAHDQDDVPVGSGVTGPKALGGMEVNALLAHNARALLAESTSIRAAKNVDFWRAFQEGRMPQMPVEKKTFNRFVNILKQAGISVDRQGNDLVAGPLTDKDILAVSNGEIKNEKRLDAKLNPEEGGLFDPVLTGGLKGDKWAHIKLTEPVINPVFESCVKAILGMDTKELNATFREHGGEYLRKKLNDVDVAKELAATEKALKDTKLKGDALDKLVRKMQYLRVLHDRGLKAGEAYTLSYFPVTPPSIRPITVGKTGDLMENDTNTLYRDLIMQNSSFKDIKDLGLADTTKENRDALYKRVKEVAGLISPDSPHLRNKGTKGAIQFVAGTTPKTGYFQRKVIYSRMNLTGRATIVPDTTLGLDQVGMPEDMAWSMYKPFIIRQLSQIGYTVLDAKEAVENRTDVARKALLDEMSHRPVVINRAPTLWKHGIMGMMPVLRSGKNLYVNSLWESAFNHDYDGDAMNVHVPVTDTAVAEVKETMLPSKQVFSDKHRKSLLMKPSNEAVVGLYKVTANLGTATVHTGAPKKFASIGDAWKAYYAGTLKATDLIEIGK